MIRAFPPLSALSHGEDGVTVIEFGLLAPVFFLFLIGSFDIGYTMYMKSVLNGAIQKAARDSGLETGPAALDAIDQDVREMVLKVAINSTVETERRSYFEFADVDRGETLVLDDNGDGYCDTGDRFQDENDNGTWDEQLGADGIGGAKDVVHYTVKVDYRPMFPMWKFLGMSPDRQLKASTVLQNQPYNDQAAATMRELSC